MNRRDYSAAGRLVLGLYVVEIGIATILFALYKAGAVDLTLLTTKFGGVAIAGLGIAIVGAIAMVKAGVDDGRTVAMGVAANLLSLAVAFAVTESTLRLLARPTSNGISIAGVAIRPTWSELAEQIRTTPPRDQTFFTYDADLGWTVGSNRHSGDGTYFSSAEGIRSSGLGIRYADSTPSQRVALIGDSNAFSLEVPFEDSWGHRLNTLLGDDVQVLNFGVDGYGIDQIYLRYQRDVRRWKPAVVVVGFIQHDLMRSMAVYPFISFGWPRYVTKPRFDLVDGRLTIVNLPLQTPEQVASATRPDDLPFIDYDPGWVDQDWDWRFDRGPLLFRLLTTLSPHWPDARASGVADTETLNVALLNELVASIERDGSRAVLVYLPHWSGSNELAHSTLKRSGQPFLDMTECLSHVPEDRRRVPSGAHYTGAGNEAIAQCTAPAVRCGLGAGCG